MYDFLKAIQKRRSVYQISAESTLTNAELQQLLETAVTHVPSAFNSQTGRVLLLTSDSHKKLWEITLEQLKLILPAENFAATANKIASFSAGYGSILYFEEQDTIKNLQKQFPLYVDHFPMWSQQASGMLQFAVWTALAQADMGASIQHYNPIIDNAVAAAFEIPVTWKLIAQMPFGKILATPAKKEHLSIDSRVIIWQ